MLEQMTFNPMNCSFLRPLLPALVSNCAIPFQSTQGQKFALKFDILTDQFFMKLFIATDLFFMKLFIVMDLCLQNETVVLEHS